MSSSATASGTLALVVGLAAAALVTVWMFRDPDPPPPPGAPPAFRIPVTVVRPELGLVTERITVTGSRILRWASRLRPQVKGLAR